MEMSGYKVGEDERLKYFGSVRRGLATSRRMCNLGLNVYGYNEKKLEILCVTKGSH